MMSEVSIPSSSGPRSNVLPLSLLLAVRRLNPFFIRSAFEQ